MASTSAATCGVSIGHHQLAISIVLLSIVLLSPAHALPRPTVGAMPSQLLLNELLASGPGNEDNNYFGEQLRYQQQQQLPQQQKPSYLDKWPYLRDLLLTVDYAEEPFMDSTERERGQGSRLLTRLHQLGDNGDNGLAYEPMPLKELSQGTNHIIKKNAQWKKKYMAPCHFKICNLGRKRNTGSFYPY